jgi:hypothetical protein
LEEKEEEAGGAPGKKELVPEEISRSSVMVQTAENTLGREGEDLRGNRQVNQRYREFGAQTEDFMDELDKAKNLSKSAAYEKGAFTNTPQ